MDLDIVGPLGVRRFVCPRKCVAHEGHAHRYDHDTIVIAGRIRIQYRYLRDGALVEGESREFGAGEIAYIKADVHHTVKPLDDHTAYLCVFSHRDFEGRVSQVYVGNQEAYA